MGRDYIHVDDLAEGHICALQKIISMGGGCIVHNLGSGKGVSVLDMVKAFQKASGKTIKYNIAPRRPGDLATVVANPAKAKRDFGWEVKRGLDEMCRSAWKWQSENPYGYDEGQVMRCCRRDKADFQHVLIIQEELDITLKLAWRMRYELETKSIVVFRCFVS